MTTELTQKLENIISGHSINEDDADWLRALTQRPAAQEVDWCTPTTYAQRFADAVALLCRESPPADMVAGWIDRASDDHRLQDWACERAPAWAQGIGLLDAAHVMADQPTEGVDHEPDPQQATPAQHHISAEALARMSKRLDDVDSAQPGFQYAKGWNAALRQAMDYAQQATPEPAGEEAGVFARDKYDVWHMLPPGSTRGTKLYTHPAPGVPDVEDLRDRLVAISAAVADCDDRAAQSMLGEILRLLAAQAKGAGHA